MDDELEAIALAPLSSPPPRRRAPFVMAIVALAVLVIAGTAFAVVSSEHHVHHNTAPPAPSVPPALVARTLGVTEGRFAIVNNGRLQFVDANGIADATSALPADVSIAAANGPSLIAVTMRHWYLVEPGREPQPLPPGNVFARQAGGWWVAQNDSVSVLGDDHAPTRLPAGTTAIADTPAGLVLQNPTTGRVVVWNPSAPAAKPKLVIDANAEILGVGGDVVVWRPAANGTAIVHAVDVTHGHDTEIDQPAITSGTDASVAPDGKHVAFYDSTGGTVSIFDTTNGAPLWAFDTRSLGTFSPFTTVPGPTGYQPLPFTWTSDGRKIIVLGTLYPVPRISSLDTFTGTAITTSTSEGLDQLAALVAFSPS